MNQKQPVTTTQPQSDVTPDTGGYYQVNYVEPSTINVSIYTRDATGHELTYQYTSSNVDFRTYVKDVLPNEWYESWGSDAMQSLYAGALAVKGFGWYHCVAWSKDPEHNANVSNGTNSQMYNAGSNKPNCNFAVDQTGNLVITNGSGQLFETGYRSDASPGSLMSQNGTRQDALNGMNVHQIVSKWYSNYSAQTKNEKVFIPY